MKVCMHVPENRSFGPLYLLFCLPQQVKNNFENNNAVVILLASLVVFKIMLHSLSSRTVLFGTH